MLQAVLRLLTSVSVDLVATDGFLHPTRWLEERELMHRKGFPESYDIDALLRFLTALKSGDKHLSVPVYSHHHYDIVPGQLQIVNRPAIVLVEGLNILQTGVPKSGQDHVFVSDFLDFSVFVDADVADIERWFVERALAFCAGPFQQEDAYFHFLTRLKPEEVRKYAERVWREINCLNLRKTSCRLAVVRI